MPEIAWPDAPLLVDGDVRLRPFRMDDVDAIVVACQDPLTQRFTRVPSPYGPDDARGFVRMTEDVRAAGTGLVMAAVHADRDRVLASVGLELDVRERTGELGYWVAPDARRRGVATRASRLLCRIGFEHLDLAALHLVTAVTNSGSAAVARRLGFQPAGRMRSAMVDGPTDDPASPRCDADLYDLLPHELT